MQFFLLGMISTLLVLALLASLPRHGAGVSISGVVHPAGRDSAGPAWERTAPWGNLEFTELPLPSPEGCFPGQAERLQKTAWVFANFSEEKLVRFLLSCGLNPIQRKALLDRKCWRIESNGCVITPPSTLIWFLDGGSRKKIYSVLARNPANVPQHYAYRFPEGTFEDFLQNCGLRPRNVQNISRLAYIRSGIMWFADLRAAQAVLSSVEFEKLAGALHATPTLALRLCVTPNSNIGALVKYWGQGGREQVIKPLLTALGKVPGGASIDIGALLPPFARKRLYTHPVSWNDPAIQREDCFFTAMNFFNENADTNLFDWDYARNILDNKFRPATGRPTYGDLVAVSNPSGAVVHVCVYIAKDIVFTKNGLDRTQPWVLMRMDNMLRVYQASAPQGRVTFFRRRAAA